MTEDELKDFIKDTKSKFTSVGDKTSLKQQESLELAFENIYGDQQRTAEEIYTKLQDSQTQSEVRSIQVPSNVAVGSSRREKLIRFKIARSSALGFIEREATRRESGIAFVEATPIEELQKRTVGALKAYGLREEEISQIKSGVKPTF